MVNHMFFSMKITCLVICDRMEYINPMFMRYEYFESKKISTKNLKLYHNTLIKIFINHFV